MKDFLKMMAASMIGTGILWIILFGMIIAAVAQTCVSVTESMADKVEGLPVDKEVPEEAVLHLKLQGTIEDRHPSQNYSFWNDGDVVTGLDRITESIEQAKADDRIKGILIEPGIFGAGTATLGEIREKLKEFKETGKPVIAYAGVYTQGEYFLCSVASCVCLNPVGSVDVRGVAYQTSYVKELMKKIGVEVQVVKVGDFKSYTEMYTNSGMSEPSRLQARVLVGDVWDCIAGAVSERGIDRAVINQIADSMTAFRGANASRDMNLVDRLCYRSQVDSIVASATGMKKPEYVTVNDYYGSWTGGGDNGEQIAVLYATGEIDNGGNGIDSKEMCKTIEKLKADDDVCAVVLRVNSPGGSAYGSEQIWHAVEQLKQKKPVVVSMGDYAASGGYYISCAASKIVADAATTTGSIGIFGVIPNAAQLAGKVGVTFDGESTHAHTGFPDLTRPATADELRVVQGYVEEGYRLFKQRCADGRGLTTDQIEKVAQGRVWSGTRAVELGLVDTLGSLPTAINIAAGLAGVDNYHTRAYPKEKKWWEKLSEFSSATVKMLKANTQPFAAEREMLRRMSQTPVLQATMLECAEVK